MQYVQSFILIFAFFISHICSFILRFSCLSIIHIFLYFYHACILLILIFISYNLIFISCHLLVTSYILLTYIFIYFIKLSYLMTYTYTFLYLYVALVLYQTILTPVGVQNIDFFFDTLRYPSCPNYLPFYLFFYTSSYQIYVYC